MVSFEQLERIFDEGSFEALDALLLPVESAVARLAGGPA